MTAAVKHPSGNEACICYNIVHEIDVDRIQVGPRLRSLDEKTVAELMESMREFGLLSPIILETLFELDADGKRKTHGGIFSGKMLLRAGLHRLEAAKRLGWPTISALGITPWRGDRARIDCELIEIGENLHRVELSALDRSKHLTRWLELNEEKRKLDIEDDEDGEDDPDCVDCEDQGETGRSDKGAQVGHPSGGEQPHDKGVSAAAKEFGTTRQEVQRAAKIASITTEAETAARETGLDDNQSALLKVAAEEPSKQAEKVAEIVEAKKKARGKRKPTAVVADGGEVAEAIPSQEGTDSKSSPVTISAGQKTFSSPQEAHDKKPDYTPRDEATSPPDREALLRSARDAVALAEMWQASTIENDAELSAAAEEVAELWGAISRTLVEGGTYREGLINILVKSEKCQARVNRGTEKLLARQASQEAANADGLDLPDCLRR